MSPFVLAPQMKNVPPSSQKSRDPKPSRSAPSARPNGFSIERTGGVTVAAPYIGKPISDGYSRSAKNATGIKSAHTPETTSASTRQPGPLTRKPYSGKKISCPVALLAVNSPITVPRRFSNQRLTIVAPTTRPTQPVPRPVIRPQKSINSHGAVIAVESPAASESSRNAPAIVRRNPKRSKIAAANGPTRPKRPMFTASAAEIVAAVQPNSFSSGRIIIDGALRTAADEIKSANAIAAVIA